MRFRDTTAIIGVGMTEITKHSGTTTYDLALRAGLAALADAGLRPDELDGVVTYQVRDSVSALEVAAGLGLPGVSYYNEIEQGGQGNIASIGDAALAIAAGMATTLLVVRAMNGRSGTRMGQFGSRLLADDWRQWSLPYGQTGPPQIHALWAQRHMAVYGTTAEQLGAVAITMREHAQTNPAAYFYGKPITLNEYLDSRIITTPFRLLDCCLETDGAAALVLTAAERAIDRPRPPVYLASFASGAGPSPAHPFLDWPEHSRMFTSYLGPAAFERAGLEISDVDVAMIYDGFTISVICQLEDLGFAPKGEGGAFVEEGHIRLGGRLPVNPNGGLLSEGYVHGMNNVVEAVRQLRHEAGDRQVPAAEVALVTGGEGARGSIALLHR